MDTEATSVANEPSTLAAGPRAMPAVRALMAEAAGTYTMVLIGTGSVVVDAAAGGRLTQWGIGFGFFVAVALPIFLFGKASGAHVNPAVTIAFVVLGRFPAAWLVPYWLAQLMGGIAASATLWVAVGALGDLGATVPSGTAGESLLVEAAISYILMFAIAYVTGVVRPSHTMTALLIGGTVGAIAAFAGPISGASMNPARTLGPAVATGIFTHHWVYWAGPIAGTCLGALAFRVLARRTG